MTTKRCNLAVVMKIKIYANVHGYIYIYMFQLDHFSLKLFSGLHHFEVSMSNYAAFQIVLNLFALFKL